jgi:DNA-binding response OmpR family regulator
VKILLVADNRKIESFVWAALCQRWWGRVTLDWKKNLSEALDTVKTDFFDAILVDLGATEMKGPESLSRLAPVARIVPVILLISEEDADRMIGAHDFGIDRWLRKETLTVSRLAKEVSSILDSDPAPNNKQVPSA